MKLPDIKAWFLKNQTSQPASPDILGQKPKSHPDVRRVSKNALIIAMLIVLAFMTVIFITINDKSLAVQSKAKQELKSQGKPAEAPDWFKEQQQQTGLIATKTAPEMPTDTQASLTPDPNNPPSAPSVQSTPPPTPYEQARFQAWQQREQERQALATYRRDQLQNALGANTTVFANQQANPSNPQLATLYGNVKQQGPGAGPMGQNGPLDYAQPQTSNLNLPSEPPDASHYLLHTRTRPVSPFEVKAGTVIPSVMIGGVNSNLPGQIIAQVSQNVYDTATGQYLLIPQGTRLVGHYDHQVVAGQNRVMVLWNRLIYPDASSVDIGGMSGTDQSGYAGFKDKTNTHFWPMFRNALMLSAITAGVQLSQPRPQSGDYSYSSQQMIAGSLGMQMNQLGSATVARNLNQAPTLTIRPGYVFNVMVNQDMILPPWTGQVAHQNRNR